MSSQFELISSPNDSRQYRYLILPNELRVLLVQDDQAEQAAASMAVNVGHFDDPAERPGMAHFLEHMLFLGTEKFPDPAEYHAFINRHGGSNNAWTGTEHTNFFYSLDAEAFESSLDRFSQFFVAPCFNLDLVERERQAIDAEYSLKLKDDIRRVYQVHKETVNPAHPFSKFSVGNIVTLGGDREQLRNELLAFYEDHYSANLMTLCMVAPLPLDTLESLARQYFDEIPNKAIRKHYPQVPLYSDKQLRRQINIVPLKDQKRLTISFALLGIDCYYKSKPLTFISHLLGNESNGSLLNYFKDKGWATALSAGGGINGYNFKDYNISVQLTETGLSHIDDIICATFAFIDLLQQQGLEDWRYRERADLLEVAFRFQETIKSMDLSSHLSINMQHYSAEDVIFGDYRMAGLDVDECKYLLTLMNPQNIRLQLIAHELDADAQADWYHTPYMDSPISAERLNSWSNVAQIPELTLPEANPFIVSAPEVRPGGNESSAPTIVAEGKGYRIWHKKDGEFNVPKGHLYLSLDSEKASATPRQAALTRLYVEMLQDYLTEFTYPAEVAGLNYNIYPHQGGLTLHISGLTGNQEKLLALIIEKARERNFSESRFQATKRQLLQAWYNVSRAKPISQLFTSLTVTLQRRSYEPNRLAECLEDVTLTELHEHVRAFFEKIHLEGLVYGDWLESEAKHLAHKLDVILTLVSSPSGESERQLVDMRGKGTLLRELDIHHPDSGIIVYYQSASTDPRDMALFSLLNHTMSSSFFHELRTQKQLGYMVGTGYLPLHRHPGMIFYIQSPSSGPLTLLQAIDEFVADFNYAVMQITTEQWEDTKKGLVQQVMEHDANQKTRSQRYWASIGNKDYGFDQREMVVAEITTLSRSDLIEFNMSHLRTRKADRLVIYNRGEQQEASQLLQSGTLITDLKLFKNQANKFSL
ncbi:insulinase family protein [Shewanella corallii]|uniref:Protease 3 n=1 Tax=Shewanella corallii TaxID=560080 RepID=A0ABT0NAA1_9GAMM|nr:insulinase family protein [Shewanella corallii]MCL2915366.1 insulinase family protein [Shewanella corallii]